MIQIMPAYGTNLAGPFSLGPPLAFYSLKIEACNQSTSKELCMGTKVISICCRRRYSLHSHFAFSRFPSSESGPSDLETPRFVMTKVGAQKPYGKADT